MARERIDKLVVERGLAETRTRAQALILAGQILVDTQRIDKPGQMVSTGAEIRVKGEQPRYVGRGGLKLEAALRKFNIDPADKLCVDVGASTGGFTDCLLQHGAARVWAVDVGHNQLDWKIRSDPRVVPLEGINGRNLSSEQFPVKFGLAVVDVSFISLDKILPALKGVIVEAADVIALIKPQFEVGKGEVGRGGIVTDPSKHARVLRDVIRFARSSAFETLDLMASPILGAEGNREFLIHLKTNSERALRSQAVDDLISNLTESAPS
ncbi:MAG: TlyA family rRNA (cytidine-2'-O)-methyltransferase [Blastocatellia bacterium AA13]|nr:MAG: TlyA family rRNA (cytidine-2'-O)-methyltransferase [Blastocatellia bacterium AA13]